jgi:hypothetical protein
MSRFYQIADIFSADGDGAAPGSDERPDIERDIHRRLGWLHGGKQVVDADGGQAPTLQSDRQAVHLRSGDYQVVSARFAPDGRVVVGAALNRTDLPVFDAETGDLVARLRMTHPSNDARFSADGRWIAASWLTAVTVLRYPTTAELLATARAQVHRALTARERAEFGIAEVDDP